MLPRSSEYVKAASEVTFRLSLFTWFWTCSPRMNCIIMLQPHFSCLWHVFLSCPQYKRGAQQGVQIMFHGMESCCQPLDVALNGFWKWWDSILCSRYDLLLRVTVWSPWKLSAKNAIPCTVRWRVDPHNPQLELSLKRKWSLFERLFLSV